MSPDKHIFEKRTESKGRDKMMIKAKFEKGVLIPQATLNLKEGEEVEIIVKPQIGKWVGILKSLKPKSSVDLQHEVKDIWSKDYVSD